MQQHEVAARVRQVIDAAGVSAREFARRIVIDPSKLSRSLNGTRRFSAAELARIADIGGVDVGWLLGSVSGAATGPDTADRAGPGAAPGVCGKGAPEGFGTRKAADRLSGDGHDQEDRKRLDFGPPEGSVRRDFRGS